LRDYDEDKDLYVKDGKIHLRIVVKDPKNKYGDIRHTYTMTDAEQAALDSFIASNPDQVYLFNKNNNATPDQLSGNYSTLLSRKTASHLEIRGLGVIGFRNIAETECGQAMKDLHPVEQVRLWSEAARQRGHQLNTTLSSYICAPPESSTIDPMEVDMEADQEPIGCLPYSDQDRSDLLWYYEQITNHIKGQNVPESMIKIAHANINAIMSKYH
ncbi:hypothetical protein GGF32_008372, partial [Allomyces javanicus]